MFTATQANIVSLNWVLIILQSVPQWPVSYLRHIAFKCTFNGCKQTFSVQGNMCRHARTHLQLGNEELESSDGDKDEDKDENENESKEASPQSKMTREEATGATGYPVSTH